MGLDLPIRRAGRLDRFARRRPRRDALADAVERVIHQPPAEHDAVVLPLVEGRIPESVRGTLYRNGPARFQVGAHRYRHLFDGDGMVTRFHVGGSGVRYTNRFVRTRESVAEQEAGRGLYRSFGTNRPGGPLQSAFRVRFKNTANTSVCHHGGELLALWEGGLPHALDPVTLRTLGRHDFHGTLQPASAFDRALGLEPAFSAHPRRDPQTGILWGFGLQLGLDPLLRLYAVPPHGRLEEVRRLRLPELSFIHDFALTERYAVFFVPRVRFDVARLLAGTGTAIDSLHRGEGGGQLLVLPRDPNEPPRWLPAPAGFVYHVLNGFERTAGQLVLDVLHMPDYPAAQFQLDRPSALLRGEIPPAVPHRLQVDLERGTLRSEPLVDSVMELPAIPATQAGRPYRTAWTVTASTGPEPTFTAIGRLDVERRTLQRRDLWPLIPSEPVHVPDPGGAPESGWLWVLCFHADRKRSFLLLLDATTLQTVATLALPHTIPPSLHGTWVGGGPVRATD